jgi:predicted phosphoribosyltransferase
MLPFRDRFDAGRTLAGRLSEYAGRNDVLVLALPRGGVPVAFEIARALGAPLDVQVVRKLGAPMQAEYAIGAIASGGVELLNAAAIRAMDLSEEQVRALVARESMELARREAEYRGRSPAVEVSGMTIILVDDGMATGSTMRAAVAALRRQGTARIVVAVPVAADSACEALANEADQVVCALAPRDFFAVGEWYLDFRQTTDSEVCELLNHASGFRGQGSGIENKNQEFGSKQGSGCGDPATEL